MSKSSKIKELKKDREAFKKDLTEFWERCRNYAYCANLKSKSYYYLNHIASLIIILSGAVVGIVSLFRGCENYIVASIGFAITALKTALSVYNPERRTVQLKTISQNLTRLGRNVKRLGALTVPLDQLQARLEEYYAEFDDLDLAMYDLGNVTRLTSILGRGLPEEIETP